MGFLFPDEELLKIDKNKKYQCISCKGTFYDNEVLFEKLEKNIHIFGIQDESYIPKCPFCDALAFFGFNEVLKDEYNKK